uniref:DapH/DapD/GlmU-related protein n=1 Tax=Agathobacter sp. TaxID=2021311 RepID=UPI004055A5E2
MCKKIVKCLIAFLTWMFVQMFGRIFYDKKYIAGKWFDGLYAEGWLWAAKDIVHRIFFRTNLGIRWPVSPQIRCGANIRFDVDDLNNFQGFGNYFQTFDAKIVIGKGCYIAANVGMITSNHDLMELDNHQQGKDVVLGEKCWIGMNSVLLPGVVLGDRTIVGAGSVVTKSFPEGNCVIGGNPAKLIRKLDNAK